MTDFFIAARETDSLIAGDPTPDAVAHLQALIGDRPQLRDYALERLTNPEWLRPLVDAGHFDDPAPLTKNDDGSVTVPWWPPSRFLLRVARERPGLVADVLLRVPETDNYRPVTDLAEAAALVAETTAASWVNQWIPWFEAQNQLDSLLVKRLGQLAARLITTRERATGLRLARVLLEPQERDDSPKTVLDPVRTRCGPHHYTVVANAVRVPLLTTGAAGFHWALRILDHLITASTPAGARNDGHEFWYSGGRTYLDGDPRRAMSSVVESLAANLWESKERRVEVEIALAALRWPVGTRILTALATEQATARSLLRALVEQPQVWNRGDLLQPYRALLGRAAERLPATDVRSLVRRSAEGPPDYVARRFRYRQSEADAARYVDIWRFQRLDALAAVLGDEQTEQLGQLRKRLNSADAAPERIDWATLTVDEIVVLLAEGKRAENLSGLVSQAAADFDARVEDLLALGDHWIWGEVLHGFKLEPYDGGPPVRQGALRLAVAASKTQERTAVFAAVRLIDEALMPADVEPWAESGVASAVAVIENAGAFEEVNASELSGDPFSVAINAPRPIAVESAVRLALWLRRQSSQPEAWTFAEAPEIGGFLDAQLDPSRGWAPVHAMFGEWLPWLVKLDASWVQERLGAIFPANEPSLREAAWRTQFRHGPFTHVFEMLKNEYDQAIDRLTEFEVAPESGDSAGEGLARHLLAEYWRGHLPVDEGLLQKFFARAPLRLRRFALEHAGWALLNADGEAPDEVVERLRALWLHRVAVCRASQNAGELAAFGSWMDVEQLDATWRLDQLIIALQLAGNLSRATVAVTALDKLCVEFPVRAFRALELLIDMDKKPWHLRAWSGDWDGVLAAALGHPDVRDDATARIHWLGAEGFWSVGRLLDAQS